MSSIDGSDGDMPAPAAVGAKRGRPSRSLAIHTLGPVLAFAVYSSTLPGALWQNVFEGENLDGYQEPGIPKYFCGVVLAQCKLEATPITDENPTFRLMRKASLKGSRRCHELVGFATWHIIEVLAGDGAQPDGFFPSPEWLSSNVADRMNSDGEVEERDMPFSHFLDILALYLQTCSNSFTNFIRRKSSLIIFCRGFSHLAHSAALPKAPIV